jgi:hypothetical protein
VGDKVGIPIYELVVTPEPDPNRRFEVRLKRGWFTSEKFGISVATNGLIESLNAKRSDESVGILAGLVGVAAKVFAAAVGMSEGDRTTKLIEPANNAGAISYLDYNKFLCTTGSPRSADCADNKFSDQQLVRFLADARDNHHIVRIRALVGDLEILTTPPVSAPSSEISAKESEVIATFLDIQDLENWIKEVKAKLSVASSPVRSPGEIMADLQETVQQELAKALNLNPIPNAPPAELTAALENLKKAIALILLADEKIHGLSLTERRNALIAFLKSSLPTSPSADYTKAYVNLAKELSAVQTAIQAVLPSPQAVETPTAPLRRATDVTSVIDEDIYIDPFDKPFDQATRADRIRLATARIKYGTAKAVVIRAPAATVASTSSFADQTAPAPSAQSTTRLPHDSKSPLGRPGEVTPDPFGPGKSAKGGGQ